MYDKIKGDSPTESNIRNIVNDKFSNIPDINPSKAASDEIKRGMITANAGMAQSIPKKILPKDFSFCVPFVNIDLIAVLTFENALIKVERNIALNIYASAKFILCPETD